jgi:hypothetical protein
MSDIEITMVQKDLYYHEVAYVRGLEARNAELVAERDKIKRQLAGAIKMLHERPTAPHPVDQLNNLSKALHEDAEAECNALRAQNAELVADQKTLDRVLDALDIADTDQDPVKLIVQMVSHIEDLRRTKATSDAKNAELVAALEGMLHAVCGETGFANAVRTVTGTAYPWPALDIAEEHARAALAAAGQKTGGGA